MIRLVRARYRIYVWPAMFVVLCFLCVSNLYAELVVDRLRCEYLTDPLGIDADPPRLSWQLESDQRGTKQSAYQILVAATSEELAEGNGTLWDSGKVASGETVNIPCEGKSLASRQQCYWKVKVWDQENQASEWSAPAQWSMGLLNPEDWSAEYISYRDEGPLSRDDDKLILPAARQYRKGFDCNKQIRRATVYATALGIYELHLNGQRVSDARFTPGWTDYDKRAYYNTFDVTEQIRSGENALGIWVADGWYSGYLGFGLASAMGPEKSGRFFYGKTPATMVQLEVQYEDGSTQIIGTDDSWRVTGEGPIQEADLLMGEFYDATRENPGWAEPGFDDSDWQTAVLAKNNGNPQATLYQSHNPDEPGKNPEPKGTPVQLGFERPELEAYPSNPVRVIEELPTMDIEEREPGTYIFDLGQNFAGVVRVRLKGPKGHRIQIRHGEMLHPDGRLMTENLRKARATDYYVCKGDPDGETYMPRFTFHGFQYVEISNFPGAPDEETVTGIVLHSDTPLVSSFECSDPMVNQLFENIVWTQRANFLELPTDCPQRDERFGWTGDAQIYVKAATYNADVAAFFTKWLRELMESQRPSGTFPGYAPFPFQTGWDFGTAWCDAGIICPWTIWQAYGDTRIVEACWQQMTRFMEWRESTSENYLGIKHGNHWGDWLAQGEHTPIDYIDTIYFASSTQMMAEMAEAIGRDEEAEAYRDLFAKIRQAFQEKYIHAEGSLTVDTQTAYALALAANLVPEEDRAELGNRLAERIAANGNRMATGFLGTRWLLPTLSDTGHHDLASFLLQSREFPSWGYEVDQGATTIWERWDSYTKEDGFGRHNAAMNSFSHYAFGAACEWMFAYLAGIRLEEPGYDSIIIHPRPPAPNSNADHKPIDWVKASYDSIHGRITSNWRVEGEDFHLEIEIPDNTTARVYVPTDGESAITIDGTPLEESDLANNVCEEENRAVLTVDSGTYRIESKHGLEHSGRPYSAVAAQPENPPEE